AANVPGLHPQVTAARPCRMADDGPAGLDGVRVVPLPAHVDVSNAMSVHAALEAELRAGVTDLAATASLGLEGLQVLLLTRAAAARQRGQAAAGGRAARRAEVHDPDGDRPDVLAARHRRPGPRRPTGRAAAAAPDGVTRTRPLHWLPQ